MKTTIAAALKTARLAIAQIAGRDLNAVMKLETPHGTIEFSGFGQTAFIVLTRKGKIVKGYSVS